MPPRHRFARLRRVAGFVRPFAAPVVVIVVLGLVIAAANGFEPLVMRYLFDELGGRRDVHVLARAAAALLAVGVAREGLNALSNWLTWRTRLALHHDLLEGTVEQLHRLPVSFHQAEAVGATMTKLDRGIQGFVNAFSDVAFTVLPTLMYLGISVSVMMRLEWRLGLLVVAFAPLPALIAARAAPEQSRRERVLLDRWAKIYSRFNEVLSGIVTVKSFVREEDEKSRFLGEVEAANQVVIHGVGTDAGVGAAQNLVVTFARITAIGVGGLLVLRGSMTLGTLVAFFGYVAGLFGPVQGLSGMYKTIHHAQVSLDVILSFLDAQDHLQDATDAQHAPPLRGDVEFDAVCFSYRPGTTHLIDRVSLHVPAGETVALVGPSGAGKSTLMALLQRFYDPSEGAIRIDGLDIRTVQQRTLRAQIGVVLQDPLLFNDTVRANIEYGRPGASANDIEAAARAAHIHELVATLPDGYETVVGERGNRLSMGERQRVAIARALLKDPPILILDEATSALDAESEALVQEALERLVKSRTTFMIAHRLSTVVRADRIVVLQGGRIVEMGRHDELVRAGGYYAQLVRRQVGGLLVAA